MPYALLVIPSTADGPIAQLAELQRLIDRGNPNAHTMGIPKKET